MISLRDQFPGDPADENFLRNLILETAAAQLGADLWPEPVRSQLLEVQYSARLNAIRSRFPGGRSRIVRIDSADAGWLYTAEIDDEIRLVEIMIAAAHRGKGAGAEAIRIVIQEADAAGKPVRLSVDTANTAAFRLYERLGFRRIGGDEVRHQMERPAAR